MVKYFYLKTSYKVTLTESRKEYKNEIRSWKYFCESVTSSSATSRLHKALAKETHYQVGLLSLPSGSQTESDEEAAEHLLSVHFPWSTTCRDTDGSFVNNENLSTPDWDLAEKIINEYKVRWS